jgi:hypothetical protein
MNNTISKTELAEFFGTDEKWISIKLQIDGFYDCISVYSVDDRFNVVYAMLCEICKSLLTYSLAHWR